jgi:hypothetical protein
MQLLCNSYATLMHLCLWRTWVIDIHAGELEELENAVLQPLITWGTYKFRFTDENGQMGKAHYGKPRHHQRMFSSSP